MSTTPNPPTTDQTTHLLGSIMATYSWTQFKPILYSPEKLQSWILENLTADKDKYLDPDGQEAADDSESLMQSEDQAFEFWGELSEEEREMMKAAFFAIWGRDGTRTLP